MASNTEHYSAYAYGDSLVQLRSTMPMVKDGESTWIHIAPFGSWKGHENGDFVLDNKTIDTIITNFDRQISPSMVDYEHDSLDKNKAGPKLAAGWIQKLERRDDGLWAFVEFVKKAADYIKAGEIKFVSPAIDFKSKDRRTDKNIGPELINIAITNMPFLDGLNPISLVRSPMGKDTITTTESKTVEKPAQLELSDDTVQAQDETIDATAAIEAIAAAAGLDMAAAVAALLDKQEEVAALLTGAAEQEGSEAEGAEATDKPADTVHAGVVESAKDKTITELSAMVKALKAKDEARELADITAKVEAKIEQGYITDNRKDEAIYLFQHEPKIAEKLFSEKVVPIDVTQAGPEGGKDTVYKLSDLSRHEQDTVASIQSAHKGAGMKISQEKAIQNVIALRNSN